MKITLNREQWEAMGKQAGWDTDVIATPEVDFSVRSPQFDVTIMQMFIGLFPALREVFGKKINEEKKERPEALKEVFEEVVKTKHSLLRQYDWLFNKVVENRNIPMSQLLSTRIKKITLVAQTDPLQPTDGVQTSEAANPERQKQKLHCKKCGGPLKKVMQKNPAGLEEAVWKCDCGSNQETVK